MLRQDLGCGFQFRCRPGQKLRLAGVEKTQFAKADHQAVGRCLHDDLLLADGVSQHALKLLAQLSGIEVLLGPDSENFRVGRRDFGFGPGLCDIPDAPGAALSASKPEWMAVDTVWMELW